MISIDTPRTRRNPNRMVRADGYTRMPGVVNEYTGKPYTRLERYYRRQWIGRWSIEVNGIQTGTRRILYVSGGVRREWTNRPWFRIEVGGIGVTVKRKKRR